MKHLLILLCTFLSQVGFAQRESISIDQLQVPSSPAFNILDISPNSIDRPKNPTDFALALGNATSGFSTIPKNYAIEVAPFWIVGKNNATSKDFIANNLGKNILQTATFSLGTSDAKSLVDSSEFRKLAFALKFSISRGEVGTDFKTWGDSVYRCLGRISMLIGEPLATLTNSDKKLRSWHDSLLLTTLTADDRSRIQNSMNMRSGELQSNAEKWAQDSIKNYNENVAVLKALMSRTDFRRYGFKLDYAVGAAWDYPDSSFDRSYISKFSTWVTLGYEKEQGINWLGVLRYNYNVNRLYRNSVDAIVNNINIADLDYGLRVYSDMTTKLTMSFEWLQRKRLFNEDRLTNNKVKLPENTNRYVFTANYKVGKNQNLSFTYGKNFDSTTIKEGNLIAALNFLIGFGSARPLIGGSAR